MNNYSVTVPMSVDNPFKSIRSTDNVSLIVNDGWATFAGNAWCAEDFEQFLKTSVVGLPQYIKAVESW